MHKPIAYQREKGIELRTMIIASISVLIVVANVASTV